MPPRPEPLPPESRTVGQLIAETIRAYGSNFWRALPLGLPLAVADVVSLDGNLAARVVVLMAAAPFFTLAYAAATALVLDRRLPRPRLPLALAAGTLAFLPAAFFFPWFALVSVAWLALVGLVVPVALAEERSFGGTFRRALALGRADYLHAAGSLSALVIVFGLTRIMLGFLLRDLGDQTVVVALFIADLVLAPILFLGGALLYVDQAARAVDSGRSRRRSESADLHPADEPDRPGRTDAEVEPRAAP